MPLLPPTGSQHVLHDSTSDATVVITEVGASIRAFDVAGRDVIVPFPESDLSPAGHGAILAPWPNRLADGAYTWDGVDRQLPITEPERRTALHGLVSNQRWRVVHLTTTTAELALETVPLGGYPWQLGMVARYELSGESLTVEVEATNRSGTAAPYGIGFHPWLSPGAGGLDAATMRLDAEQWVRPDDRLLPAGVEALPEKFDFREARAVGATDLDDAFVGALHDADGLSWIHLTGADGRTASVWMDSSMDTWQVCSGDHISAVDYRRRGMAAEPMSCIADAFNSGDRLVRLEPGASHTVRWGLALS